MFHEGWVYLILHLREKIKAVFDFHIMLSFSPTVMLSYDWRGKCDIIINANKTNRIHLFLFYVQNRHIIIRFCTEGFEKEKKDRMLLVGID